jgi:prepilin-type N-terminal cleavage/methylation domain-containing protein
MLGAKTEGVAGGMKCPTAAPLNEMNRKLQSGFSMIELMVVVAIALVLMAMGTPLYRQMVYGIRLRSAGSDLSALMQRARIQAARQNAINTIAYRAVNGAEEAYIDLNLNGQWDAGEPIINFSPSIIPAAGAPTGVGGQPTPYVLVGDTGNVVFNNGTTLGFSPRGLPCAYAGGVCATPAGGYFVYYLNDLRSGGNIGWAAVVVTRSGRTKTVTWSGAGWQ